MNDNHRKYSFFIPLCVFAICVITTWITNIDVRIESLFFDPASGKWPLGKLFPFLLAYNFGEFVGLVPGLFAIAILIASIRVKKFVKWRRACWFIVALFIVAPLFIVNVVLKDNWGRPRPKYVEEFGGIYKYQPALVVGDRGDGKKSFPSGHAAMGFCFMAPYFIFNNTNRKAALAWLWSGIAAGIFIGLARMTQGAHWPSDVVWSFGIVYFSGYALARIMRLDSIGCDEQQV